MPHILEMPEHLRALMGQEPTWRAVGFEKDPAKIIEVGRLAPEIAESRGFEYYQRELPGTADHKDIDDLATLRKKPITPLEAEEQRRKLSAAYRLRPLFASTLYGLYRVGFLELDVDMNGQEQAALEDHPNFRCGVKVGTDGEVRVGITDDPSYTIDQIDNELKDVTSHEYVLPRSTPYVIHNVTHEDEEKPVRKYIYGDYTVAKRTWRWLLTMQHRAGDPHVDTSETIPLPAGVKKMLDRS